MMHHDSKSSDVMMTNMRTTITLEPDVQALIRAVMKERGVSFKEALNSAVRAGLTQPRRKRRTFVQQSFSLGPEQNVGAHEKLPTSAW
jgi:hypothetical protein